MIDGGAPSTWMRQGIMGSSDWRAKKRATVSGKRGKKDVHVYDLNSARFVIKKMIDGGGGHRNGRYVQFLVCPPAISEPKRRYHRIIAATIRVRHYGDSKGND